MLCQSQQKTEDVVDVFNLPWLLQNGDHLLNFYAYKLCFANYLMARYPNGPGQFIFGLETTDTEVLFPVDYSALNTSPSDLEHYSPDKQTNRHSVVVWAFFVNFTWFTIISLRETNRLAYKTANFKMFYLVSHSCLAVLPIVSRFM